MLVRANPLSVNEDKPIKDLIPTSTFEFRIQFPNAMLEMHSEEHLVIRSSECRDLNVGDRLIGIPQHVCPTVSLYDFASILSDDDDVIGQWPIEARSRRLSI